jgi:hypothetical protein
VDGNNPANQERQTIVVPKGNRYAALLVANRTDFGGPLVLGLDKLPPGVTMTADQMDPGLNIIPVVFEAKADAPIGGHLAAITAIHADAAVKVPAKTAFDAVFSIGANNVPYTRHYFDRTAVAVTDVAPYSIEVIEPKVPLVQNGSFNLRIVAKRAAGFTGAITVFPLWTPPGLGIQGSAVIPAGATETLLPMNAAPNAAVRKWKTAVHAVADAGKGPVWTSSQLFTLEVAAPIITLAMERPAVEQGQTTQLFCKVAVTAPFEGKAKVRIIGLPAKVTTQDLELTKDSKEIAFAIVADKASPVGKHGIFAQVVLDRGGELITGNTGGTELRIDVPLPPKVVVAAPVPPKPMATTPPPMPTTPAQPPKRLTRLEQLRLDQEEREKAQAGQPAPKKEEPPKKP